MELIVISNPQDIENEARLINDLFTAGLSVFHLRKPMYDTKQIRKLLNCIDKKYHAHIALHQHHEVAARFGIKRFHYTEQARNAADQKKWQLLKDQGYTLSTSVHDAILLPSLKWFDYIFYGPVFNSISKPGYQSKLPAGFYINKEGISSKIIALGGVDLSNLVKVKGMNFDGAALLGAIWNDPERAIDNFRRLKETAVKYEQND